MLAPADVRLELEHIQSGALHERPSPYVGRYLLLRIDDRAAGRELVRRLHPVVDAAADPSPARDAWVERRAHLPRAGGARRAAGSLDSFAPEFRQGMAARAAELGDTGESSPEHWEAPLGTPDVHVVIASLVARRRTARGRRRARAAGTSRAPGVEVIWRQDCYQLPTGRTSFGFKDGIGQPAIEGSGIAGIEPARAAAQGGRVRPRLPRRDGRAAADADAGRARPQRHVRRLPQAAHRVAAFRQYLRERPRAARRRRCSARRWWGAGGAARRSRCPPSEDDPELGADPQRNNDFLYGDDLAGFKCPAGAHARRANPRDALDARGQRRRPPAPDDPARHELRADAARGRARGRRRGPRDHVRLRRRAPRSASSSSSRRSGSNDGIFIGAPEREGPARRARTTARHVHDPAAADPPAAAGPAAVRRHARRRVLLRPGLRALRWLAELDT